jgi:hypothetical protein
MIFFVYFSKKVEVMSVEMESLVTELLSKCYYGRTAGPAAAAKPAAPATPAGAPVA